MVNIEELKEFGLNITEDMKEGKVVIDIYTTWCGPCRFLSPILEKLKEEGLIKLLKVDLDENRPLGEHFQVTSIPTLLFFHNGKLVDGIIEVQGQPLVRNGMMTGAAGEDILKNILAKI